MRLIGFNVGSASIEPGRAVKYALGFFTLLGATSASAALALRSGFAAVPSGAYGRVRVIVAGGSVSAGTLNVQTRIPGAGPVTRTLPISISGAGTFYTDAATPASIIVAITSSAGFGSGTTIAVDLEIRGVAAAADGSSLLAGVAVGPLAAQWTKVSYTSDEQLDATTTPPGVLVSSSLVALLGKDVVIGASGLGRMRTTDDAGDVLGSSLSNVVVHSGSAYYLPIKVNPRADAGGTVAGGLTLWATPAVGELGYMTGTSRTLAKAKADSINTSLVFGAYEGIDGSVSHSGIVSVLFAAGLNSGVAPASGQRVYLSDAVAGRATNVQVSADNHVVAPIGILEDATGYDNGAGSALPIAWNLDPTVVIAG